MKITKLTPHLLTTQWTADPWFPQMLHSTAIIRVETNAGIDGLGEATIGYFSGESVPPLIEYFRSTLVGKDALDTMRLTGAMFDECVWWGRGGIARSVIAGIELALWDLKGKALGVPVYQLIGGATRDRIPVYASGGPAYWPIENNVKKVAYYLEQGYRATKLSPDFYELEQVAPSATKGQGRIHPVKLSFAKQISEMVRSFTALRKEFPDFDLMIDGHQGAVTNPITATEAVQIAQALAPFRLRFYEEPLAFTDLDGYRELKPQSTIPIACGESFSGLAEFHPFIADDALHVVQPDVGFVGGLHETLRVIHHAEASNIKTAIHCGASMGPSQAASWHIAAACKSVEWLEQVPAARKIQGDLMIDRFEVKDGFVGLPTEPGLGVRLTEEHLRKYPFVPGTGERT